MDYTMIIYIVFGILPSLVWLFYYLRKDLHPEPRRMIIKIFLWGALMTLPVSLIQEGLSYLLGLTSFGLMTRALLYWFLVIALSEEFFKYLVVKVKVMDSPHLDEPLDIMLYMVVAALGFAAVENILYLFQPIMGQVSLIKVIEGTLILDIVRFIGATFLHTLCSATIGYSLAISVFEAKRKKLYLISGILIAMVLHGLYDFSIMTLSGSSNINIAIPVVIIMTLALLVFSGFERLKKMKSICKLK